MKAAPKPSAPMPALSQFQKFTMTRWPRAELKNAPYNPRTLTTQARKLLTKNLKTVGLLAPIVVNSTTSHILAGHQKLAILDVLEGTKAYALDVSVVKLPPKREREQNVFMNNPAAMGAWDLAALGKLLPDLDVEATGFGQLELESLLGLEGKGLFSEETQSAETQAAVGDIADMKAAREEEQAAAKGRREKMRKTTADEHEEENTERIIYVMCPSVKAREAAVGRLGFPKNTRYVPVKELLALIGGKGL